MLNPTDILRKSITVLSQSCPCSNDETNAELSERTFPCGFLNSYSDPGLNKERYPAGDFIVIATIADNLRQVFGGKRGVIVVDKLLKGGRPQIARNVYVAEISAAGEVTRSATANAQSLDPGTKVRVSAVRKIDSGGYECVAWFDIVVGAD